MTVASATSKVTYNANGATTQWPFPFRVIDAAHLQVIVTGADGVAGAPLSGGYTVHQYDNGTGYVVYPSSGSPLASGNRVTLLRHVPLTQETDLVNQGGFYAEVHEDRFDLLAMADQQQQEQIDRTVKLAVTDSMPVTLPGAEKRAGRLLAFDSDGMPKPTEGTLAAFEGSVAFAAASGQLLVTLPPVTSDGTLAEIDTGLTLTTTEQVFLTVGNVHQPPGSGVYTVAGTKILFPTPIPAGLVVQPRVISGPQGATGVSVQGATVDGTGHLILTLDDGSEVDAGFVGAASDWANLYNKPSVFPTNTANVSGLAAALALLAPLASPALTGTPTAPTAAPGTNSTQVANTAFVAAAVAALVNSSPAALDTLAELAAALGNDASFATTVTNALAAKAPLASPTFTGTVAVPSIAGTTDNSTKPAPTSFVQAVAALLAPLAGATFTGPARSTITTLTDGATITANLATSNDFTVTLGGNRTLALSNVTAGQGGSIRIAQDATGSRTITWPSQFKWVGGSAGTLSTAASAVDRIDYFAWSSTEVHVVLSKGIA